MTAPPLTIVPRVANSETLLIKRIAAETGRLIAEGAKIISLSQGVPNLPIFDDAKAKMHSLVETSRLPYSDVPGLAEARKVAASFVTKYYSKGPGHCEFNADNVIITAGGIQAVYNVLALTVGDGDIVASTIPAYGLYAHQAGLLGGRFEGIELDAANDYTLTPDALKAFFARMVHDQPTASHRVRSLILCYPNNPTGAVLTEAQARGLAEALDEIIALYPTSTFTVVLDEVYVGMVREGGVVSILQYASERLRQRCFLVLSCSKGLGAMPGARAAWVTAAPEYVAHMTKIQNGCSGNASTISQEGLIGSLTQLMREEKLMRTVADHYVSKTTLMTRLLNELFERHGLTPAPVRREPAGTFYIFADLSGLRAVGLNTDVEVQEYLRDMYKHGGTGVAIVPGCAFAMAPERMTARFSCAREPAELEQAVSIFEAAIVRLKQGGR